MTMISIKTENLIPQFTLEKCKNCSGYGAIGNNPRIICPTCKGVGSNKIPLIKKAEEVKNA